mmetsp:Transcript_32021/g.73665  ORF Transcript_32021/g.73665 Transcript_32021/m.73665 type:complete len:89 (-) Transcript_32021:51-317(-)
MVLVNHHLNHRRKSPPLIQRNFPPRSASDTIAAPAVMGSAPAESAALVESPVDPPRRYSDGSKTELLRGSIIRNLSDIRQARSYMESL